MLPGTRAGSGCIVDGARSGADEADTVSVACTGSTSATQTVMFGPTTGAIGAASSLGFATQPAASAAATPASSAGKQ